MAWITVNRTIKAPICVVFGTVADIREMSKALPHVKSFEFLTDAATGVGTRFRETRLMKGREEVTEIEVTEYVENDRVRMVADSHGTVWDTVFSVSSDGTKTALTLTMDARPHTLTARMMTPLIRGMVAKAVEKDMDLVKAHCVKHQE